MPGGRISPWLPEQDRLHLAVLGKLAEECNELAIRATRCIIQGIDEADPESRRSNRIEMQREIADVLACIATAEEHFRLDSMPERFLDKRVGYREWHQLIADQEEANG